MNVFDVCFQIRLDANKGKGKKCPGGYSIPAGKKCGGKKKKKLGSPEGDDLTPKLAAAGGLGLLGLGAYAAGSSSRIKKAEERHKEATKRGQEKVNVEGVDYDRKTIEAASNRNPTKEEIEDWKIVQRERRKKEKGSWW